MRIAVVSTPFVAVPPRGYGGTELVVHHLSRGLAQAGHEVTLFATGDSAGADVRWVYERPVWPPEDRVEAIHVRAAAAQIARERFDIVHAHTPAFLRFARALRVPVVYTLHHDRDEHLVRLYRRHREVRYVAISRRQADLVPELRCDVVHHGLHIEATPTPGRQYALFLGRLSFCKGLDLAVRAAADARIELVVAGSLHDEVRDPPRWREYVHALLAIRGVHAIGSVSGDRKEDVLAHACAVLMPIRWEEPFGLVMIEAILHGTPVVALRRGAAPEIIDEGVTGFVVDDESQLTAALVRAATLDRARCWRRAHETFGAARMAREYVRVYRRALGCNSENPRES